MGERDRGEEEMVMMGEREKDKEEMVVVVGEP